MNVKKFSNAMSELDSKYVDEAIHYKKKKPFWIKLGAVAACLAIVIAVGGILAPFSGGMIVSAYAYGTNEEITAAGAVMNSGTISESGEMKGHPLMFYLSGKDIATVRFSCKNEIINFVDWTEKRDEYGSAQNFTVSYGEDESEYYYLVIDWIPNSIIRELTDNENSTITTLPVEMRNDIIAMEIVFENGETAVKAITISLLDDGTFFASFDDYQISEEDTFINRPDSEAIPRDILYSQDDSPAWNEEYPFDDAPVIEDHYKEAAPNDEVKIADEAARAYYENTVFEVVSLELKSQTENEIIFSVCASKDGVIQEPNRTITLQLNNGTWEVMNEGY